MGDFGKLLVVHLTEPHTEPSVHCFVATKQWQSQTCSTGHIRAVVRDTVQWGGTKLSLANVCSPYLGAQRFAQPQAHAATSAPFRCSSWAVQCWCGGVCRGAGLELGSASSGTQRARSGTGAHCEAGCARIPSGSHV